MKKLIRLSGFIIMMILLGFATHVEAKKGQTTASPSSKTTKSSSYSKLAKNLTSNTSNKNGTNQAFSFNKLLGKTAKDKQGKSAWQAYNKALPANVPLATVPAIPAQDSTKDLQKQLADLKKQLETERNQARNERLVSQMTELVRQIGQVANARKQQTVINHTLIKQSEVNPVSSVPVATNPAPNTTIKPTIPSNHHGLSLFWIIMALGATVVVIIWLVKRNQPTTIYRI